MNTDARDNFRTHYRAQVHLNRQNHLQPQMNTDTRDNFRTQTYRAQVHLNRQIFDIGVSDARSLATDLRPIQKLGGSLDPDGKTDGNLNSPFLISFGASYLSVFILNPA